MDTSEYLKGNNPPRGDTYILMCGKNFFEAIKGAMEKLTPEVKAKIVNRYVNKVSKIPIKVNDKTLYLDEDVWKFNKAIKEKQEKLFAKGAAKIFLT